MNSQNKHYEQLAQVQRYQIQALRNNGFSLRQIAQETGKHYSTISRELKRNTASSAYCAKTAEHLKDQRKKAAHKFRKHDDKHEKIITDALYLGWSPENTSARMQIEMPDIQLSHTTIYRRIAENKSNGGNWYKKLPRFGKTRWKASKRKAGRSVIPERVDISERPEIVDKRERNGDWEGDTVYGQDAHIVTLVDRKSRFTLIGKVPTKAAGGVADKMVELLSRVDTVHTITLDNGSEFAQHKKVATATHAQIYFAKPYASYQRGTNENTNGIIRRHWPKKMKLGALHDSELRDMEWMINTMPRKVLGGLTPLEVYTGKRVALMS